MAWQLTVSEVLLTGHAGQGFSSLLGLYQCLALRNSCWCLGINCCESITEINAFLSSSFRSILWSRAFKRIAQRSKSCDKAVLSVGVFPSAKLLQHGQKKPLCKLTWALHNIPLAAHPSHSRSCGTVSPAPGSCGARREHDTHSSQQWYSPAVSLWLWMKAAPST